MTIDYDAQTDSLYVTLADRPSSESREIAPDVIADYDAGGGLVGLDIQHASQVVELGRLETRSLPLEQLVQTASAVGE